jgi:hypothetical protein
MEIPNGISAAAESLSDIWKKFKRKSPGRTHRPGDFFMALGLNSGSYIGSIRTAHALYSAV